MAGNNKEKHIPRLPACQSCYMKKVKCDNARPKCTLCTRNGQGCFIVNVDDNEPVSREYIYELEERARHLQSEIVHFETERDGASYTESQSEATIQEATNHELNASNEEGNNHVTPSPNFTESVGISFMSLLFADSGWRGANLKILQNLSKHSGIPETSIQPNALPSEKEAWEVFDNYLTGSHVQNPFLLRRDVQRLYHSVFCPDPDKDPLHSAADSREHDMFRTFMILAIGSVTLYRTGRHKNHPYGYFLTAMQHFGSNLFSRGLDSIQDLLLVVRFGIYHHIGTSIWELNSMCMRMCIGQGLHRPLSDRKRHTTSLLQQQIQRRVFWECYMIDRYSSITLGRPPAITDTDIQIEFPADANDEELDAADVSGSFTDLDAFRGCPRSLSPKNTEMTVFFFCLRLRKITSKIQRKFRHQSSEASTVVSSMIESITTSGQIYADLDELLSDLDEWRRSAPIFPEPCGFYQTQQWYDLLLMRERLLLVRKAIDLVPKRNNIPPHDLLSICLEYAIETIMTFCPLFENQKITYTRSYFQMLFTAGLSVMFCVSVLTDHDLEIKMKAAEAMGQGEKAIKRMGRDLPDAVHYVAVYEALRVNVLGKLNIPSTGLATERVSQMTSDGNCDLAAQPDGLDLDFLSSLEPRLGSLGAPEDYSFESWGLSADNSFWDMDVGLGEYAYGDPMLLLSNFTDDTL